MCLDTSPLSRGNLGCRWQAYVYANKDDAKSGVNALIRQYLDTGGRVVWICDIPFFRRGRKGARSVDELEDKDKKFFNTGAPANVLGVVPVSGTPIGTVEITKEGSMMGIKGIWSGIRPIVVEKERVWKRLFLKPIPRDKRVKVLARSRYLVAYPWIRSVKRWRFNVRRLEVSVTPKIEVAPEEAPPEPRTYWETYANAWFKNFNEKETL